MGSGPVNAAIQFHGVVIDRSCGRHGLRPPSSKELMEKVPAWPEFICRITGWDRVEPGTLTLDCVSPLPGPSLREIEALGGPEPEDLFLTFTPEYVRFLKNKRGERRFFGAKVINGEQWQIAAVSQQDWPACKHRLELYASVNLRKNLGLRTEDQVVVEVFHRAEWPAN